MTSSQYSTKETHNVLP